MMRARKVLRSVAVFAAVWTVGGAGFPFDEIGSILGGLPCC